MYYNSINTITEAINTMTETMYHEGRKLMLRRLWERSVDEFKVFKFLDGSENIFLPGLKLEALPNSSSYFKKTVQLYDTGSDMYNIMNADLVWYACDEGLRALSKSCLYENATRRTKYAESGKDRKNTSEETLKLIESFKKSNTLTFNQIKQYYDTKISKKVSLTNQLT